jgi:hypothetical protein
MSSRVLPSLVALALATACSTENPERESTVGQTSLTTTPAETGDGSGTSSTSSGDASSMATTSPLGDTSSGESTDGVKFDLAPGADIGGPTTYPVRMIPGLVSITFYERSGGDAPTPYTFAVDGPELSAQLPDPLSDASHDIIGVTSEFYDVYYSDIDGVFDLDGRYLTISGQFAYGLPAGGGLNLAEIGLDYEGMPTEFGNYVASFVALGDNAAPRTVGNTIDGDLQTHTTMGNTIGATERLRVTLGFESSSGPPG